PDKARAMEQHYDAWLEQMAPPASGHPKRWTRESSGLPGKRKERRQRAARSGGKPRKARNTGK
ncbi:MAG: hypothetical protein P8L18_02460, partial [Verrucomicrobiota bacterium]|nr:hypothetical protein [Verrucomicrobiota bacterium]